MAGPRPVLVTGIGLAIPGVGSALELIEAAGGTAAPAQPDIVGTLGKRGLRYKDRATQLALCATAHALRDAGLPTPLAGHPCPDAFGVVASSNLSNLDTVCRVASSIHSEGVETTSPMELPNASSNIVASSIAIWFGLKGLNLMICNGATSGVDALYTAANAIRAGRADGVVVVGVETVNEVVASLMRQSAARRGLAGRELRLLDGAAAVVLQAGPGAGDERPAPAVEVCGFGSDETARDSIAGCWGDAVPPGLWLTPNLDHAAAAAATEAALGAFSGPVPRRDLSAAVGECYGALGVLQCAVACAWLRSRPDEEALVTCGGCYGDGYASLHLRAGPSR
jgi:3-oxoacyl-[acyl-carrier-protein] synthase II